jgi:hypothetical protein
MKKSDVATQGLTTTNHQHGLGGFLLLECRQADWYLLSSDVKARSDRSDRCLSQNVELSRRGTLVDYRRHGSDPPGFSLARTGRTGKAAWPGNAVISVTDRWFFLDGVKKQVYLLKADYPNYPD